MNDWAAAPPDDEPGKPPKNDSVGFAGIFLVSFVVFLAIALCAQLVALPWRSWLPGTA